MCNKLRKKVLFFITIFVLLLSGCAKNINTKINSTKNSEIDNNIKETNIRIITTSDLHGKMLPWDYYMNEESPSGSLAQVASIIKKYRNDNTIVVDVGDLIQDNNAELFLNEDVHPMIQGINGIGYDVCTLGNHEFNFGMENVKKVISAHKSKVILSNVYGENGDRLAAPYTILEKGGVKIGLIGVVTPNIIIWDKNNLIGYKVTNPIEEIRNIINEIKNEVDVIITVAHMDDDNELGVTGSSILEISKQCPEIDFICAAHGHEEVVDKKVNGCPFVENLKMGETAIVTDIKLSKIDNKWKIDDIISESIKAKEYEVDKDLFEIFAPYDEFAKEQAAQYIGKLQGGPLVDENIIIGVPRALLEDTPLIDFISEVFMYYSGADVAVCQLLYPKANIKEGDITNSDINRIYKFSNNLCKLKMTGKQLKKCMENTADFYKQTKEGDLTIAFNDSMQVFKYGIFSGVNYEINISKPVGERIENLTWLDGRIVKDDDVFTIAANNYQVNSVLMMPGEVFVTNDEMPEILEIDMRKDIGDIKKLIIDYIVNVKKGIIESKKDDNWKITGFEVDVEKQKEIDKFIREGKIILTNNADGDIINTTVITNEMLEKARMQ